MSLGDNVGFQWTPFGPVSINADGSIPFSATTNEPAPGAVTQRDLPAAAIQAAPVAQSPAPLAGSIQRRPPLAAKSTGNVLKDARARIKEIRAELKYHRALQKELAELERLLKAAREKPEASVRPLRSVG